MTDLCHPDTGRELGTGVACEEAGCDQGGDEGPLEVGEKAGPGLEPRAAGAMLGLHAFTRGIRTGAANLSNRTARRGWGRTREPARAGDPRLNTPCHKPKPRACAVFLSSPHA